MTKENKPVENRTSIRFGSLLSRLDRVVEESDNFDNRSQAVREYVRRGVLREEIESRTDETEEELATDGGRDAPPCDRCEEPRGYANLVDLESSEGESYKYTLCDSCWVDLRDLLEGDL